MLGCFDVVLVKNLHVSLCEIQFFFLMSLDKNIEFTDIRFALYRSNIADQEISIKNTMRFKCLSVYQSY